LFVGQATGRGSGTMLIVIRYEGKVVRTGFSVKAEQFLARLDALNIKYTVNYARI
jgi:hypothetical protein